MNIGETLNNFEEIINDADKDKYGDAAVRPFTIYRDVIMYLITNGKLIMSDDESVFWNYAEKYTISALYRVAEHYRKENDMPRLNYTQPAYHNKENTLEEWRGQQSYISQ